MTFRAIFRFLGEAFLAVSLVLGIASPKFIMQYQYFLGIHPIQPPMDFLMSDINLWLFATYVVVVFMIAISYYILVDGILDEIYAMRERKIARGEVGVVLFEHVASQRLETKTNGFKESEEQLVPDGIPNGQLTRYRRNEGNPNLSGLEVFIDNSPHDVQKIFFNLLCADDIRNLRAVNKRLREAPIINSIFLRPFHLKWGQKCQATRIWLKQNLQGTRIGGVDLRQPCDNSPQNGELIRRCQAYPPLSKSHAICFSCATEFCTYPPPERWNFQVCKDCCIRLLKQFPRGTNTCSCEFWLNPRPPKQWYCRGCVYAHKEALSKAVQRRRASLNQRTKARFLWEWLRGRKIIFACPGCARFQPTFVPPHQIIVKICLGCNGRIVNPGLFASVHASGKPWDHLDVSNAERLLGNGAG